MASSSMTTINPDLVRSAKSMTVTRDRRGFTFAAIYIPPEEGGSPDVPVIFTLPTDRRVGDTYSFQLQDPETHIRVAPGSGECIDLDDQGDIAESFAVMSRNVGAFLTLEWQGEYWKAVTGQRTWMSYWPGAPIPNNKTRSWEVLSDNRGPWLRDVTVLQLCSDRDQSGVTPTHISGRSWIANNWAPGEVDKKGNPIENGGLYLSLRNEWVLVRGPSAEALPGLVIPEAGTRALVMGRGGLVEVGSSFAGYESSILESNGFHWVIVPARNLRGAVRVEVDYELDGNQFASLYVRNDDGQWSGLSRNQQPTDSVIVVEHTQDSETQNGNNLIAAYERAKTLRPCGYERGDKNRVVVFVPPGSYLLPESLVLDAEYIDLEGVGVCRRVYKDGQRDLDGSAIIYPETRLVLGDGDPVVRITADHLAMRGFEVFQGLYPATAIMAFGAGATGLDVALDDIGLYGDERTPALITEDNGMGGQFCYASLTEVHTDSRGLLGCTVQGMGTFAGNVTRCTGGHGSFAGNADPALAVPDCTFLGVATDCVGLSYCFGANAGDGSAQFGSGLSGFAERCDVTEHGFGSAGGLSADNTAICAGILRDCRNFGSGGGGGSGGYSFGFSLRGNAACQATLWNCSSGAFSFGCTEDSTGAYEGSFVGKAQHCTAGDNSFGAGPCAAPPNAVCEGTLTTCTSGLYSFGGRYGRNWSIMTDCAASRGSYGTAIAAQKAVWTRCKMATTTLPIGVWDIVMVDCEVAAGTKAPIVIRGGNSSRFEKCRFSATGAPEAMINAVTDLSSPFRIAYLSGCSVVGDIPLTTRYVVNGYGFVGHNAGEPQDLDGWVPLPTGYASFSSTSEILIYPDAAWSTLMNWIHPGMPLKIYDAVNSEWSFHLITGIGITGTQIAVQVSGKPVPAGMTKVHVGAAIKTVQKIISIPGNFNDADDQALIQHDLRTFLRWDEDDAILVGAEARCLTADSGGDPSVNVYISGRSALSGSLAVNGTSWNNAGIAIERPDVIFNDLIDVSIKNGGSSNGDAQDLTVALTFLKQKNARSVFDPTPEPLLYMVVSGLGGPWCGLGDGVHLIRPSNYVLTPLPSVSPYVQSEQWTFKTATSATQQAIKFFAKAKRPTTSGSPTSASSKMVLLNGTYDVPTPVYPDYLHRKQYVYPVASGPWSGRIRGRLFTSGGTVINSATFSWSRAGQKWNDK